jgi:hypothetical protein
MQTRSETIQTLKEKREYVMHQISELEEAVEYLNGTIAFLEKEGRMESTEHVRPMEAREFPVVKLHGLTQLQAVVMIAKHFRGIVKAQDAKRLMIKGGVMKETKNSTNITHNLIIRSELFDRIAPGEYRLKARREPNHLSAADNETLEELFPVTRALETAL